ncbi:MAG TPA: PH domain-containing protein [Jatrophihabitantaceae bacterium]|nr:PH domain-containing protein [Jatrophihabitantaceae bacterium]
MTFRLPRSAYLIVLFLVFCTVPLALAGNGVHHADPDSGSTASDVVIGWRLLFLLIPVLAAFFIARTRTQVDADGIRVRALFGGRRLPWDQVRGLSINDRSVYAVCADGSVRLPCVRVSDLNAVSAASEGRLPDIPPAKAKYAPSRRPRGRAARSR